MESISTIKCKIKSVSNVNFRGKDTVATEFKRGFRTRIGGSVVECSPATRAARVRFPADATF